MKIRLTRRLTALLVLLWTHSAAAIQLLEVRDGGVVSARISGNEPNRLVIRDGRVHKVWGAEGKAVLKPDSDAGQVYLQPSEAWRHRPFSLFVKDEEGGVYTLVLTPTEMPSETVTLIRPELATVVDQEKAVAWESEQPYERTLLELVRHMAMGKLPDGYTRVEIDREIKLWRETHLLVQTRYMGGRIGGEVYELTNVDKKSLRLEEREFYRDRVLAVSIERHALAPGERTKIYLVTEERNR
ncbi:MAG: type-F conjugative transfer system secretin TraK [Candidatus Thiodiazotropha sp.]